MKKYKNIISLGFFCSPAMEIQRIGLRKRSYPFDWLITAEFENVIKLIKNKFDRFTEYELFYQIKNQPYYYRNNLYNVDFYHDFTMKTPLDKQFSEFESKYKRRIDRFYKDITEPTLFIRYASEHDYKYINENHEKIEALLKSFNQENEIIYVFNKDGNQLLGVKAYSIEKDKNDGVAREFLKKLPELTAQLTENVESPEMVIKQKNKKISKNIKKVWRLVKTKLGLYYKHDKTV